MKLNILRFMVTKLNLDLKLYFQCLFLIVSNWSISCRTTSRLNYWITPDYYLIKLNFYFWFLKIRSATTKFFTIFCCYNLKYYDFIMFFCYCCYYLCHCSLNFAGFLFPNELNNPSLLKNFYQFFSVYYKFLQRS